MSFYICIYFISSEFLLLKNKNRNIPRKNMNDFYKIYTYTNERLRSADCDGFNYFHYLNTES